MKLSIFSDELGMDITAGIIHLRDWGLRWVDFRGQVFGKACEALDDDELARLRALVDENDMKVGCLQSSLAKVHLPAGDRMKAEQRKLENIIRAADALDCPLVRAFFYWQPPAEQRGALSVQPDLMQQVLDRMAPLAERARQAGLTLAFENCGTTVEECTAVLDALGVGEWGLAWDCANEWLSGGEPPTDAAIGERAKRSRVIHAKATGAVEGLSDVAVPWEKILLTLASAGYDGPVSAETHNPDKSVTNLEMSRRLIERLRAAWPAGQPAATARPRREFDWKPVRFVVVGMGMGRSRSKQIVQTPGVELAGVVDIDADRARSAGEELGVEWTTKLEPWLDRDDVDAVFVLTPTGLHAELAVQALEGGKPALSTKPMEASVAGCDRMLAAAERAGKLLAVDFDLRCRPDFQRRRRRVTRGDLGRILGGTMALKVRRTMDYFRANGGWRGTWKLDGGGAMSNQNIHHIDELVCLLGLPRRVCMHIRTQDHDIEAEDLGCALWEYPDGAVVQVFATTCYRPGGWYRHLELHGTDGALTHITGGPLPTEIERWFTDGEWETKSVDVELMPWANSAQNFAAAIREGAPLICDGRDGRRSRLVLDTMYESARQDGVWVDVPEAAAASGG